jgi:hypothetical protein
LEEIITPVEEVPIIVDDTPLAPISPVPSFQELADARKVIVDRATQKLIALGLTYEEALTVIGIT